MTLKKNIRQTKNKWFQYAIGNPPCDCHWCEWEEKQAGFSEVDTNYYIGPEKNDIYRTLSNQS